MKTNLLLSLFCLGLLAFAPRACGADFISVAVLDLMAFGQNLTPEQWYDAMLLRMGRQLDLEESLERFWKAHLNVGPCQRFFDAIREVVLTAINRTTPHSSVFFKLLPGPFGVETQYDIGTDFKRLAVAEREADVIHIHSPASTSFPQRFNVPIVYHHHGTRFRNSAEKYTNEAKKRGALVLVSNLELLSWGDDYPASFLPNTVPVARYLALAEYQRTTFDYTKSFRIAHSPTVRERKGTTEFLNACSRLRQRGYPLEIVLIEGIDHDQSLLAKASCHAVFDSFWLGMQCSGIEGAAMGLPVIAGDEIVARRYREQFGSVPYTFADCEEALEAQIQRLMDDPHFYQEEASRVHGYVMVNHDESAVALTYLDLLDRTFRWRAVRPRVPELKPCCT